MRAKEISMKRAVTWALNLGGDDDPAQPIPEKHAEVRYGSHLASLLAEDWYNREGQTSDEEVGITLTYDDGSTDVFHVDIEVETSFHAYKSAPKATEPA
jgi:hypothetical protein